MRKLIVATVAVASVAGCQVAHLGGIEVVGAPDMLPPATLNPQSCGRQEFALAKVQPNVMMVLDRSGSMIEPIATGSTTTKYDDLRNAIGALVSHYDSTMRLGATFFAADNDCQAGVVGAIAAQNGAAIRSQLAATAPGGDTPTAATLDAVIASKALADLARANYLVLATDGIPNCDDVDVRRRIDALYAATPRVRTFIIGIGSETDTAPDLLNAWADAGHTARRGDVHYYQTNSATALDAAFDAIAGDIATCDFIVSDAPEDPQYISVSENGVAVSPSPTVGWTYDAATHTLSLHGAACDVVKNDAQAQVSVVYGCQRSQPIP